MRSPVTANLQFPRTSSHERALGRRCFFRHPLRREYECPLLTLFLSGRAAKCLHASAAIPKSFHPFDLTRSRPTYAEAGWNHRPIRMRGGRRTGCQCARRCGHGRAASILAAWRGVCRRWHHEHGAGAAARGSQCPHAHRLAGKRASGLPAAGVDDGNRALASHAARHLAALANEASRTQSAGRASKASRHALLHKNSSVDNIRAH